MVDLSDFIFNQEDIKLIDDKGKKVISDLSAQFEKIEKFNSTITVSGDKSISIRWILFSSIANGISTAQNLLMSEDVMATIKAIKTLGIKVSLKKKENLKKGS